MTLVLEVRDLQVRQGLEVVLDGLSLEVGEWEIVGILGSNGSGKSTLLAALTGLVRPHRGTVLLRGVDVTRMRPHQRTALGLARTWAEPAAVPDLSVLENLLLAQHAHIRYGWVAGLVGAPATFLEERELVRNADEILDFVGAWDVRAVAFGALPSPLRWRCGLAMALATDPTMLLVDEPSSDAEDERRELGDLLQVLRSDLNLTIVVCESKPSGLARVCDFVYPLSAGRLGPPAEPREAADASPEPDERPARRDLGSLG